MFSAGAAAAFDFDRENPAGIVRYDNFDLGTGVPPGEGRLQTDRGQLLLDEVLGNTSHFYAHKNAKNHTLLRIKKHTLTPCSSFPGG
ncbi:hypothetical protein [Marinobacterium ramblicola]|uniref:hypothetical protein n=1 Tax=Marinobacterium ramblicola TaxID=2849041 RepID=UPI001FE45160|nr:hypothetical protein [Marinobacterium ramblicola]